MPPSPTQSLAERSDSPSHHRSSSDRPQSSPRSPKPQLQRPDLKLKSFNLASHNKQASQSPLPIRSDANFGPLSPGATDRVFPIRSVVSVDPSRTPSGKFGEAGDEFPGLVPHTESDAANPRVGSRRYSTTSAPSTDQASECSYLNTPSKTQREVDTQAIEAQRAAGHPISRNEGTRRGRPSQKSAENASIRSTSVISTDQAPLKSDAESVRSSAIEGAGLLTARFKHVVTEGNHAIITGRDGDVLQRCEDEPIHIPGAIQGFGLLIALQEGEEGKLSVRVASENSSRVLGYTPRQLFELENFCDILSEEQAENLLDHLDFIRDGDADPATNGPEVFTLSIQSFTRKMQKFWCAMHINGLNPDMIICEFELEDDPLNPLVPASEPTPEPPEDTLHSEPTVKELAESTVNASRPLRVLRSARKRKGEAAAMEVFNVMSQVQEQLSGAENLEKFLKILVGVVKELTGFHRVMIYQFDHAWNGRVVTELVDPRATKDLYKGLNFPASDIPKQARDLYKLNKVRLLYDRDQQTARLVCRTVQDLETPLDLTYSYLRAMSPIHIKYLANMAVRSSMSISINAFNDLWGLIACHSYGSKGMRVSFPVRKMCRLVGDSASRNVERLSYASRLQARKLINTVPTEHNPSGYIIASSEDLLNLFDADYGLLSIRGETKILGRLEQTQEALAMLEYLRLRKLTSVLTSTDIHLDFPDLRYPPGFSIIAGLLFVPLSVGGNDFIVFFRKSQMREVKWAGNPYEKFIKQGTEGYLEPRKSFKTWSETIVGQCRDWTEEQIETAAVLCLVYGKFIEVWRQKEVALQNSQLTKLLLANSAHEVRTPLNAIINYLEIALEGSIDSETREHLSKSHSASKSLIHVVNDLLDLTKTEEGNELVKVEIFDLPATVREATSVFEDQARRKNIEYDVCENPGVPRLVVGDQRKVRQAISNITANAVQHTNHGSVKVDLLLAESSEGNAVIDIAVQDTGSGMSPKQLDELFRDLEQVQSEGDDALMDRMLPDTKAVTPGVTEKRILGLGLAVVARLVRNMNGQLRLKSEEGKGSRFVVQLSFDLPPNDEKQRTLEPVTGADGAPPASQPITPPITEGEVLLVDKSGQKSVSSAVRRKASCESMQSYKSGSSAISDGGRSDVDRLIEDLSKPPRSTDHRLLRSASRASRSNTAERPQSTSSSRPFISRPPSLAFGPDAPERSELIQSPTPMPPGRATVMDQSTPIKSTRMVEQTGQYSDSSAFAPRIASEVLFDTSDKPAIRKEQPSTDLMTILVAEDDLVNSKIIKKRLENIGHEVFLTVDGEECSSVYGEKAVFFDVILMDIQMPILDGIGATKKIRSYEKTYPSEIFSGRAANNGRVPIFAVSASLAEKNRQVYIDAGFDGWILKPIDFKRLNVLLNGIVVDDTRRSCLYRPGEWERGGWFLKSQPDVYVSSTKPSPLVPVSTLVPVSQSVHDNGRLDDPISKEQDRADQLETDGVLGKSEA